MLPAGNRGRGVSSVCGAGGGCAVLCPGAVAETPGGSSWLGRSPNGSPWCQMDVGNATAAKNRLEKALVGGVSLQLTPVGPTMQAKPGCCLRVDFSQFPLGVQRDITLYTQHSNCRVCGAKNKIFQLQITVLWPGARLSAPHRAGNSFRWCTSTWDWSGCRTATCPVYKNARKRQFCPDFTTAIAVVR